MQKTKKIWFDGKFVDWDKAQIHVLTHALHYGSGVFEGIRCYKTPNGPAVFRLTEHINRFFYSAKCINMKLGYTKTQIQGAILELIKINKISECYIRPIAFYGYGKMGLNPTGAPVNIAIAVWHWGAYLGKDTVKIKISKYIRLHPKSVISDAKICGYYINSIFASLEADKAKVDEALLLDFQGNIAEGPGENIFIIKNKIIYTPKTDNILPGITRNSILQIAQDLKIKTQEKNLKPEDLKKADEAFFCGTAAEVCGINKMGVITKQIKTIYLQAVKGKNKKYQKWLTYVNK